VARTAIVILGGSGFVGTRVRERWVDDVELIAPTHAELDVLDTEGLRRFLEAHGARLVLNLAAWADVDGAEAERDNLAGRVFGLNARLPTELGRICAELDAYLLHVSTDYVFDGTSTTRPYRESDPTAPIGWYAQTKLHGEEGVLRSGAGAGVARIEMPFSGIDQPRRDFARICLARLRAGEPLSGVTDQRITPVFLDDAIDAFRLLLEARYAGLVHVSAATWTTPYLFARGIADRLRLSAEVIEPTSFAAFTASRPARRPQHSWLDVTRFAGLFGSDVLRSVEAELDCWVEQVLTVPSRA
jgi:dTDP-4-dehydrorhamnose reductase